jgi:hypothetical protein
MAGSRAPLESASAAAPLSDMGRRKERCIEKDLLRAQCLAFTAAASCSGQFKSCYVLQATKATCVAGVQISYNLLLIGTCV